MPRVLLGLPIVGAAFAAVLVGALIDWGACLNDTSEACRRQELAHVQFAVGLVGLVAALGLAVSIIVGRRGPAWVLAGVAATTYVSWAVLADAAHHGWDDLKLVPFL